jgi:hypothetical protein
VGFGTRIGRVVATVLLVGVLSLGAPAASSSAAGAGQRHTSRCAAGTVPLITGHRRDCLPLGPLKRGLPATPRASATKIESVLLAFADGQSAKLGKDAGPARRALAVGEAATTGTLVRGLAGAKQGDASTAAALPPPTEIPPPPGQAGSGASLEGSATGNKGPYTVAMTIAVKQTGFAAQCPDADGVSVGTADQTIKQSFDISGLPLGARLKFDLLLESEAKLTGYVNGQGKLSYYDADVDGEIGGNVSLTVAGHTILRSSDSISIHAMLTHLVPGVPFSDQLKAANVGQVSFSQNGSPVPDLTASLMQSFAELAWSQIKNSADNAYERAEDYWYLDAACLKATFSPDSLQQVDPGSAHRISVSVATIKGDVGLSMALSAGVSNGSVDPDQADTDPSSPAQFTFAVSDKENATSILTVTGVSKRGRVNDSLTATTNGKLELTITDTESGNIGPGDQYEFGLSADFPVSETTLGSGALGWTTYSEAGMVACGADEPDMYFTYSPVGTAAGQLTVTAIKTQPSLALDFSLTDPTYTYYLNSECAGTPSGDETYQLNPLFQPIDYGTGSPVALLPNGDYEVTGWTQEPNNGPWTVILNEHDGSMTLTLSGKP